MRWKHIKRGAEKWCNTHHLNKRGREENRRKANGKDTEDDLCKQTMVTTSQRENRKEGKETG